MSGERALSLIHNARNRLSSVIARVSQQDAAELHIASAQLASALAILRLEDRDSGIRREEVIPEIFFADLVGEATLLAPPELVTTSASDFSACTFQSWIFDTQLVRLVLIDALMNAWRHARRHVHFEASCRDGELHFGIEDDGPGFPGALLDAFSDSDTPLPRSDGTGLGLRLARRVAMMHSTAGQTGRVLLTNGGATGGARFCLILP